jgi:hypothetical protein
MLNFDYDMQVYKSQRGVRGNEIIELCFTLIANFVKIILILRNRVENEENWLYKFFMSLFTGIMLNKQNGH